MSAYPVPQTPAAPLAELVRVPCPNCEQGAILINQGTWTEQYSVCPTCNGTSETVLYRCEICDNYVTEHEIDLANVCTGCFNVSLESIREDAPPEVLKAEVASAKEVAGWL